MVTQNKKQAISQIDILIIVTIFSIFAETGNRYIYLS